MLGLRDEFFRRYYIIERREVLGVHFFLKNVKLTEFLECMMSENIPLF